MVPLLAMALADGLDEPVESGVVEDEVAFVKALPVAAGRVELPVGVDFTVTETMVVFVAPVACATPAIVLFAKSGAGLVLADGARVAWASTVLVWLPSTTRVMLLPRGTSVADACSTAAVDGMFK